MVQLMDVLRKFINGPFEESFDIIFIENIKKKLSKKSITFFSYKKFLKIFSKPMLLVHSLIFPVKKILMYHFKKLLMLLSLKI